MQAYVSCDNLSTSVDKKSCLQVVYKLSTTCLQVVCMVGGGFWFVPRALVTLRSRCKWSPECVQEHFSVVHARIGSLGVLPTCWADVTLVTSMLMLQRSDWKQFSDCCVRVLSRPGSTCASTAMTCNETIHAGAALMQPVLAPTHMIRNHFESTFKLWVCH